MSKRDLFTDRVVALFAWLHAAVFAAMLADLATSPNPERVYWKILTQVAVVIFGIVFFTAGGWYFWSGKFNRHSEWLRVKLLEKLKRHIARRAHGV